MHWRSRLSSALSLGLSIGVVAACGSDDPAPLDSSLTDGGIPGPADGDAVDGDDPRSDGGGPKAIAESICYASGFCWENPFPYGGAAGAVAGSGPNDVWVISEGEFILRWNGTRFVKHAFAGSDTYLANITVLDATHAWAVGVEGKIVFWNGTDWTLQQSGTNQQINAVSAVAANDVWAVARNDVRHFDGATWSAIPAAGGPFIAVYAANASEVRVVSDAGSLLRWNGSVFVPEVVDGAPRFKSVWGAGGTTWAGTENGILVWNGSSWSVQASNLPAPVVNGFALDATHAYASGWQNVYRLSGGTWTTESRPGTAYRLWASSPTDLWHVGWNVLDRHDGTAWKHLVSTVPAKLHDVAASDASNVVAVGDDATVLRRVAGEWTKEAVPDAETIHTVWTGGAANTVVAGINGRIHRWNGATWTRERINDVSVSWEGATGLDATHQWLCGGDGTIAHYDGTAWKVDATNSTARLLDVFALDPANVWAVGTGGTILHFDGSGWQPETSGTTVTLVAVWGANTQDVWALGEHELFRRIDGAWTAQGGFGANNSALAGSGPNDVWASSTNGDPLHHWDGTKWTHFPHPNGHQLEGLAMVGTSVWTVGAEGAILLKP